MYLERFEYFCPDCLAKGIVSDVLINPEMLIVRGKCPSCGVQGSYKAVDLAKLTEEYATLIASPTIAGQIKVTLRTGKFEIVE